LNESNDSRAAQEFSHKSVLTDEELSKVKALAKICNRIDSLDYLHPGPELTRVDGDGTNCFLYSQQGSLTGFLGLFGSENLEAYLIVHPQHRREGIGSALLGAAKGFCKEHSAQEFLIVCEDKSSSGLAFIDSLDIQYKFSEHRLRLNRALLPKPAHRQIPIQLQRTDVTDVDVLAQLMATSFGNSIDSHLPRIAQDIRKPTHKFFIARVNDEPIGCLGVVGQGSRVYIIALGVRPEQRGRGFGRWMLTEIASRLIKEDWNEVLIEVQTDNRNALALYHSCGFEETTSYHYYLVRAQ
jgi:ribosomal protein S18 acetylase RimI-like enzyme